MKLDLVRTFLRSVDPGDTILDVGANIGGYTIAFREHHPDATIHAFEPIPWLFKPLAERFASDPGIHCWNLGVGNKVETVMGVSVHEAWTINRDGETPHARNATHGHTDFDMRVTTVDAFLRVQGHSGTVSAIKIDTDGYDFRVLQGADETIAKNRPRILIEFGYCITDLDGLEAVAAMVEWIRSRSYDIYNDRGERCAGPAMLWYPFHTTADFLLIPNDEDLLPYIQ